MTVQEIVQSVVEIVKRRLPEERWRVLLFGSQATGTATPTSDIDIAIDGSEAVDASVLEAIVRESDALPTLRKIDIVDLATKNKTFQESIRDTGKILS